MANFNFNKVILGGRLTADPELKSTQNGVMVTSFNVAVNRRYSGENKEQQTDFISCVAWRQQAEFVSKYFRKGSSICVVGSIQTRSWTDQNGQKRYTTEVVADEIHFVDSKGDNTAAGDRQSGAPYAAPAYGNAPAQQNYVPDAYTYNPPRNTVAPPSPPAQPRGWSAPGQAPAGEQMRMDSPVPYLPNPPVSAPNFEAVSNDDDLPF